MESVKWAEDLAYRHLAWTLPRRLNHVVGVVGVCERFAVNLNCHESNVLLGAAWLHDIGYARNLAHLRFHPLDGARFLRSRGCTDVLCGLVAFHSSAYEEARQLNLLHELGDFTDRKGLVRDLLWYADMTTGPDGQRMTFDGRMADVRERYGPDHYVTRALDAGMPEREAAVRRAEEWIKSVGLTGQV